MFISFEFQTLFNERNAEPTQLAMLVEIQLIYKGVDGNKSNIDNNIPDQFTSS